MRTATAGLPPAAEPPASERVDVLAPGVRLGAYELLAPLASGGMGHVWSAVRIGDFGFRRTVAVKVMREELAGNAGFRRMFLDEARLASRISHSNVVEVLDLGESAGTLFLAMALVEGDSLSHLLRAQYRQGSVAVPTGVIARIVIDVLRGLHAAHELRAEEGSLLGFVHRDVSPQNVLVGVDGVAKITDFGVAKAAGAAEIANRSHRKGKVAYMAPEQFRGDEIDRRSDVFAVGVMLWELLVGGRMQTSAGKISSDDEVPHPTSVAADANRVLGDIAMKALAIDPTARFATAEAMADAVEHAAHDEGIVLSAKSVAAWVAPLVSDDVARRRHDTEVQLAKSRVGSTLDPTQTTAQLAAEREVVKSTRWPLILAAGSVFLVGALTFAFANPGHTTAPAESVVTTPASSASGDFVESPPPVPTESSAMVVDAPPAATASESASKGAPARSAPRKRVVRAEPTRSPAPKPKYGNPYETPAR